MIWDVRRDALAAPALRRAVYDGDVFLRPSTAPSRRLVATVRTRLAELFACAPDEIRDAPGALPNAELFARVGELRKELYLAPHHHEAVREVVAALGLDPARVAFDPLRVRVILHQGHANPLAAAVYYPHRDTWYGHPPGLINWWIPLDDLAAPETFEFYPERFRAPVANDSELFDYGDWVREGWALKIGWQRLTAGLEARYPRAELGVERGRGVGFACAAGDNLVFSGAQFHATLPQATGRARFSLDFRIVDLDDHAAGLGAPNVDNRSRGSALVDYVQPR